MIKIYNANKTVRIKLRIEKEFYPYPSPSAPVVGKLPADFILYAQPFGNVLNNYYFSNCVWEDNGSLKFGWVRTHRDDWQSDAYVEEVDVTINI